MGKFLENEVIIGGYIYDAIKITDGEVVLKIIVILVLLPIIWLCHIMFNDKGSWNW